MVDEVIRYPSGYPLLMTSVTRQVQEPTADRRDDGQRAKNFEIEIRHGGSCLGRTFKPTISQGAYCAAGLSE